MASAELSRRVEKVVGYPPLSEMGADQRSEFQGGAARGRRLRGPAWEVAGGGPGGGTEPAEAARGRPRLGVVERPWTSSKSASTALVDRSPPSVFPPRSPCRIRTIWRRPPQGHAGIVSVRVGTSLQVTFPHPRQTCSATLACRAAYPIQHRVPREVRSQRQAVNEPPPLDVSHARPATRCECPDGYVDGGHVRPLRWVGGRGRRFDGCLTVRASQTRVTP